MTIARSVADILRDHVTLELEGIDRMYLNIYVPFVQTVGGIVTYLRKHRGLPYASTASVAPMTETFVRKIEQFIAQQGIDLVSFEKGQRKDDVTQKYLRQFQATEGVLYVGKAQERRRSPGRSSAAVPRLERPIRTSSKARPWSITTTSTPSTKTSAHSF